MIWQIRLSFLRGPRCPHTPWYVSDMPSGVMDHMIWCPWKMNRLCMSSCGLRIFTVVIAVLLLNLIWKWILKTSTLNRVNLSTFNVISSHFFKIPVIGSKMWCLTYWQLICSVREVFKCDRQWNETTVNDLSQSTGLNNAFSKNLLHYLTRNLKNFIFRL